jgi:hypothetical protein
MGMGFGVWVNLAKTQVPCYYNFCTRNDTREQIFDRSAEYYHEEGFVDIMDGPHSFRTLPTLVASHPSHLPKKCMLLLGVPQLNELDIQLDLHRETRGLPLASYDPQLDFSADTRLQCHLSEKDLLAWADHHHAASVGITHYTYLNVVTVSPPMNSLNCAPLMKNSKPFTMPPKAASPPLPTTPPFPLISRRCFCTCSQMWSRCHHSLCSPDGPKTCWTAGSAQNQSHRQPRAPTSSAKPRPMPPRTWISHNVA